MIFIDTGAFLARYIRNDQHHTECSKFWGEMEQIRERFFTSNFVIDETLTLLARRTSYSFAAERAIRLYDSTRLNILRPAPDDELTAVKLFMKYADQKVSFTDCISCALMQRHKIPRAFTFDDHFRHFGFEVLPHKAM